MLRALCGAGTVQRLGEPVRSEGGLRLWRERSVAHEVKDGG